MVSTNARNTAIEVRVFFKEDDVGDNDRIDVNRLGGRTDLVLRLNLLDDRVLSDPYNPAGTSPSKKVSATDAEYFSRARFPNEARPDEFPDAVEWFFGSGNAETGETNEDMVLGASIGDNQPAFFILSALGDIVQNPNGLKCFGETSCVNDLLKEHP